jgi:hypothetical protein
MQTSRINRGPEINPLLYSHLILHKGTKNTHEEKTTSSTNGTRKTGYLYIED